MKYEFKGIGISVEILKSSYRSLKFGKILSETHGVVEVKICRNS